MTGFFSNIPLIAALLLTIIPSSLAACPARVEAQLQHFLSKSTKITRAPQTNPFRWSVYHEPTPSLFVSVGDEADVASIVKYANKYNYSFLVQNGGNGWADTFNLEGCSLLIDISNLRRIEFSQDRTRAYVQGGVGVRDLVTAAAENQTRIATATCNCLGFLGAALGGGQSRIAGLYGLSVDQLIEVNVVLASGEAVCASASSHPDLWWALRGAGPNFGIVTSAIVKANPQPPGEDIAWAGALTYTEDKVESVMRAINSLQLRPNMQVDFTFNTVGAPSYTPILSVTPFFVGNSSAAEAAFAPLFKLGPSNITANVLPYNLWNSGGDSFCTKGGRKPAYGASLAQIDAPTWVAVFNEFKSFVNSNRTAFGGTVVLAENYATAKQLSIGNATSSYPFRNLGHHVIAIPAYTDPSLDSVATAWAAKLQNMWWKTAGAAQSSYINFAHGSEPLSTIYGSSLARLQQVKKIYDPHNRFNQWFPLTPGTGR